MRQSKRAFLSIGWQMTKTLVRFLREFESIKAAYRSGYDAQTTRAYWERKLA